MFDKRTTILLSIIFVTIIVAVYVLVTIYIIPYLNRNVIDISDDIYYITNSLSGMGIANTSGEVLATPIYSTILRIEDTAYVRGENSSYFVFLDKKSSVALDSKETQAIPLYDAENKLQPYFVLQYKLTESSSIYRIYSLDGTLYTTKDFVSLSEIYNFLEISVARTITEGSTFEALEDKYEKVVLLDYETVDGYKQYIVTSKEDAKQAVIDEKESIIIDFAEQTISKPKDFEESLLIVKNSETFVFNQDQKFIKVDNGFDFTVTANYIIQSKEDIVTKIYDMTGELMVTGLLDMDEDMIFVNTSGEEEFLLLQEVPGVFTMYDLKTSQKTDKSFKNLNTTDIIKYSDKIDTTAIIYSGNEFKYVYDFATKTSAELDPELGISGVLDYGFTYVMDVTEK